MNIPQKPKKKELEDLSDIKTIKARRKEMRVFVSIVGKNLSIAKRSV